MMLDMIIKVNLDWLFIHDTQLISNFASQFTLLYYINHKDYVIPILIRVSL